MAEPTWRVVRLMLFLQVQETFDPVSHLYHIGIGSLVDRQRLLRVEEHTGAETHTSVGALKDIVVLAALTALPEFFIVGQFGECHGFISHSRIELHDGKRGGDGKKFCERKAKSSQLEGFRLDGAGKAKMTVFGVDNQSGRRNEISMTPALDVAEPYEPVAVKGHHAFTARDFLSDIFGCPLGDTCAALKC